MRELARTVCGSSLFWAHGDDLVRHELAVIVQAYAEEVGTRVSAHVVGIKIQLGIVDVRFMLLVEGRRNLVVDAVVLLLFERRGHDVVGTGLVDLGRGRVEILRQVAALRATNRVLVVEDGTSNLVLDQIRCQVGSACHDLRGDRLSLDAGVVRIGAIKRTGSIGLRVLMEDNRARFSRRIGGRINRMEGVVRLAISHHLDEQLVARGKSARYVIALVVLKDRLDLEGGNGREVDSVDAFIHACGDGVLVGNRPVSKGLATVVVARDNLLVVLRLAGDMDELIGDHIARLVDAALCLPLVVAIVCLLADLDRTHVVAVGSVVCVYVACDCSFSVDVDLLDAVVRVTARLVEGREQVPVVLVSRIKADGVAGCPLNPVVVRIGLAEGVGGLIGTLCDAHHETVDDIPVFDLGAARNGSIRFIHP